MILLYLDHAGSCEGDASLILAASSGRLAPSLAGYVAIIGLAAPSSCGATVHLSGVLTKSSFSFILLLFKGSDRVLDCPVSISPMNVIYGVGVNVSGHRPAFYCQLDALFLTLDPSVTVSKMLLNCTWNFVRLILFTMIV